MLNYLKAEIYQLTHRRSVRNWFIFLVVMALIIHPLVKLNINYLTNNNVPWFTVESDVFNNKIGELTYTTVLSVLYSAGAMFIVGGLVNFAFNSEIKNRTFINTVSYSYSRMQIYMAKWLSAFILCVASLLVFVGLFTISTLIFYKVSWDVIWTDAIINIFVRAMIFYIMSLSFFMIFTMNAKFDMGVVIVGLFSFNVISNLVATFYSKYEAIEPYLFINLYEADMDANKLQHYIIWGIGYTILFNLIGCALFKRKEIK